MYIQQRLVPALSVALVVSLSACGGGGGGGGGSLGGGGGGGAGSPNYFFDYSDLLTDFYLAAGSPGYTSPGNLPTSATYTGVATLAQSISSTEPYFGQIEMEIEFGGGSLSGSIDEFTRIPLGSTSGVSVDGSFTLIGSSTGNNSVVAPAFTGLAAGELDGTSDIISMEGYLAGSTGQNGQILFTGSPFVGFGYIEAN